VNDGLQVVENWNSTNEFICYGRHGEMATNSREQQEATTLMRVYRSFPPVAPIGRHLQED
jgi:hypothetical protein